MSFSPVHVLDDLVSSGTSFFYVEEPNNDGETEATSVTLVSEIESTTEIQEGQEDADSNGDDDASEAPSIGNDGFVTGIAPGTLVQFMRGQGEDGESEEESAAAVTILNSVPSQQAIAASEIEASSGDFYAVSPHPTVVVAGDRMSISTTETGYQDLSVSAETSASFDMLHSTAVEDTNGTAPSEGSEESDYGDDSLLSLTPSMMDSSNFASAVSSMEPDDNGHSLHESTVYENVGNRLVLAESSQQRQRATEWFSRFTEQDWSNLRQEATDVLEALDPATSSPNLPPAPPNLEGDEEVTSSPGPYSASDWVTESFLCPLCEDVIVGAVTLACGCRRSSCCQLCWEGHSSRLGRESSSTYGDDLASARCPSCFTVVNQHVPCRVLDEAILQTIQTLPSEGAKPVQSAYYSRLKDCRSELLRRHASETKSRRDKLLAELIQQEEEVLEQIKKENSQHLSKAKTRKGFQVLGEVMLAIAFASMAAAGLKGVGRR